MHGVLLRFSILLSFHSWVPPSCCSSASLGGTWTSPSVPSRLLLTTNSPSSSSSSAPKSVLLIWKVNHVSYLNLLKYLTHFFNCQIHSIRHSLLNYLMVNGKIKIFDHLFGAVVKLMQLNLGIVLSQCSNFFPGYGERDEFASPCLDLFLWLIDTLSKSVGAFGRRINLKCWAAKQHINCECKQVYLLYWDRSNKQTDLILFSHVCQRTHFLSTAGSSIRH